MICTLVLLFCNPFVILLENLIRSAFKHRWEDWQGPLQESVQSTLLKYQHDGFDEYEKYDNSSLAMPLQGRRLSYEGTWHDAPKGHHAWYICEVSQGWGACKSGGKQYNGNCYFFEDECKSWDDAKRLCLTKHSGWLVTIKSYAEQKFVEQHARKKMYHLGAEYRTSPMCGGFNSKCWLWVDGSLVDSGYRNWRPGQPDYNGQNDDGIVIMNFWEDTGEEAICFGWWLQILRIIILAFLGLIILGFFIQYIIGCVYKGRMHDKRTRPFPPPEQNAVNPFGLGGPYTDFKIGLCGCFQDYSTCMHGFCCPFQRIADTYAIVDAAGYWCVISYLVFLYFFTSALDCVVYFFIFFDPQTRGWLLGLLIAAWFSQLRGKLRQRLGAQNAQQQCCMDFLCWWFCFCCINIQEARTVDAVQNIHQECCCSPVQGIHPNTQMYGSAMGMVGGPVAIGQTMGAGQVIGQPVAGGPVVGQVVQPAGTVIQPAVVQAQVITPGNETNAKEA